jgi:hypothetical protein
MRNLDISDTRDKLATAVKTGSRWRFTERRPLLQLDDGKKKSRSAGLQACFGAE